MSSSVSGSSYGMDVELIIIRNGNPDINNKGPSNCKRFFLDCYNKMIHLFLIHNPRLNSEFRNFVNDDRTPNQSIKRSNESNCSPEIKKQGRERMSGVEICHLSRRRLKRVIEWMQEVEKSHKSMNGVASSCIAPQANETSDEDEEKSSNGSNSPPNSTQPNILGNFHEHQVNYQKNLLINSEKYIRDRIINFSTSEFSLITHRFEALKEITKNQEAKARQTIKDRPFDFHAGKEVEES